MQFKLPFTPAKSDLDVVIDELIASLQMDDQTSEDYATKIEHLGKLATIKRSIAPVVTPEVLIPAAASLLGILAILSYEHGHVVTSKALGFVKKPN